MTFALNLSTSSLGNRCLKLVQPTPSKTSSESLSECFTHYAKSIIDRVASSFFQNKGDLSSAETGGEEEISEECGGKNGSFPAVSMATFDGHNLNEIPILSLKDMEMLESIQCSEKSGRTWTYHPYNGAFQ